LRQKNRKDSFEWNYLDLARASGERQTSKDPTGDHQVIGHMSSRKFKIQNAQAKVACVLPLCKPETGLQAWCSGVDPWIG
jgi:hypothetical protein